MRIPAASITAAIGTTIRRAGRRGELAAGVDGIVRLREDGENGGV